MRKNAKFNRNALRGLVAALALGGLQVAHAGYAQLASPAGYASTSGGHTYAAAANDRIYGRVVHQAGALTANVGGQAVKMPAAYRLAANAPRIAAAVVYANPYVRVGVGIAAWIAANYVWDAATNTWKKNDPNATPSDGWEYAVSTYGWHATPYKACLSYISGFPAANNVRLEYGSHTQTTCNVKKYFVNTDGSTTTPTIQSFSISRRASACPSGWYSTPAGCTQTPQMQEVPQEEFVEDLVKRPMPSTVPQELPYPTPLPVEQPFINPAPGENPANRPQRVPTGQPVPIPNTDPQQWRQPYVDIVPAPTPDNPWRVDIKPGEVESPSPDPIENPDPDGGTDKPTEEQDKSLCEKHPDILACQKPELDVPDGEIPRTTKQITYAEEGGFGGGSCPSNVYANLHGKQTMVYEWTRTCSVVSTYIRPIILLLGAMGALFILIPGRDT